MNNIYYTEPLSGTIEKAKALTLMILPAIVIYLSITVITGTVNISTIRNQLRTKSKK